MPKKKETQIVRIARLRRMGLSHSEMAECTGFSKEAIKTYIWRLNNPDKYNQKNKDYYARNKEKIKAYQLKYYKANKEEIQARNAEYWATYTRKKPGNRSLVSV